MNWAFDDQDMDVPQHSEDIADVPSCSEHRPVVGHARFRCCHALLTSRRPSGTASASGCGTWLIGKSQALNGLP